jgi:polyhydroxyalkanoate synthase
MMQLPLQPDQILKDALDFNQKISRGMLTLRDVGDVEVGVTPKEAVYREDKLVLYRYKPTVDKPAKTPLLIVYALVNRPYMTDLQEDRSIVRNLLDHGEDVYLIDWGYPDGADRFLDLNDYINRYIHHCVQYICKAHGLRKINLLGICQGGTFSLCYTALHAERVANLVTMVTPVDFHTSKTSSATGPGNWTSTCSWIRWVMYPENSSTGASCRSSRSGSPDRSMPT